MVLLADNINFQWSGFNDSMPNYIEETMMRIKKMTGETDLKDIFDQAKEKLMLDWKIFY